MVVRLTLGARFFAIFTSISWVCLLMFGYAGVSYFDCNFVVTGLINAVTPRVQWI
jgi:hypothetical protein